MENERTTLLLGATGLVGGELLGLLLEDPSWTRVDVLARRPTGRQHPRLREHQAGLDEMRRHAELFAAHTVFCCLGTTIRAAGSQEAFRRVDLDAVAEAAALASSGGARQLLLVTAAGASPTSRIFYNRVKGEAEEAVRRSGVPAVTVLRPSLILGPRATRRPAEALAQRLMAATAPLMVGPLRRLRAVPARAVALALLRAAAEGQQGYRVLENEEILALGADRAEG
jgi:uncharacterized protein YbjT (DUF2867 family)